MELLALCKPIKKPPRSDEGDGELFCGTVPHEMFSQYIYPCGYSFDNEKYLAAGGWTVTGDYIAFTKNQSNAASLSCKQPCTVMQYDASGLVDTYTLTYVGQTISGGGSGTQSGTWIVY